MFDGRWRSPRYGTAGAMCGMLTVCAVVWNCELTSPWCWQQICLLAVHLAPELIEASGPTLLLSFAMLGCNVLIAYRPSASVDSRKHSVHTLPACPLIMSPLMLQANLQTHDPNMRPMLSAFIYRWFLLTEEHISPPPIKGGMSPNAFGVGFWIASINYSVNMESSNTSLERNMKVGKHCNKIEHGELTHTAGAKARRWVNDFDRLQQKLPWVDGLLPETDWRAAWVWHLCYPIIKKCLALMVCNPKKRLACWVWQAGIQKCLKLATCHQKPLQFDNLLLTVCKPKSQDRLSLTS